MLTAEKPDRELIDMLIDKILIHGEKDVEIVWLDRWQDRCYDAEEAVGCSHLI